MSADWDSTYRALATVCVLPVGMVSKVLRVAIGDGLVRNHYCAERLNGSTAYRRLAWFALHKFYFGSNCVWEALLKLCCLAYVDCRRSQNMLNEQIGAVEMVREGRTKDTARLMRRSRLC